MAFLGVGLRREKEKEKEKRRRRRERIGKRDKRENHVAQTNTTSLFLFHNLSSPPFLG